MWERLGSLTVGDWLLIVVLSVTLLNASRLIMGTDAAINRSGYAPEQVQFVSESGEEVVATYRPGTCRYIIIANPDCPACQEVARIWTAELREGRVSLPDKQWSVFWLVTQGSGSVARLGIDRRLFEAFPLKNDTRAMRQLRLEVFPWHVVLDHHGNVVSSGPGSRLPAAEDFLGDCDIRAPRGAELEMIG